MQAIAEGVETEAQRAFLKAAGCDEFQGFLYAPALDSVSFEKRLGLAETPPPVPRMRLVSGAGRT
jgi:EAL domain-containing protein (putative c-di-GMP-specific phosphodiesterase class I)